MIPLVISPESRKNSKEVEKKCWPIEEFEDEQQKISIEELSEYLTEVINTFKTKSQKEIKEILINNEGLRHKITIICKNIFFIEEEPLKELKKLLKKFKHLNHRSILILKNALELRLSKEWSRYIM